DVVHGIERIRPSSPTCQRRRPVLQGRALQARRFTGEAGPWESMATRGPVPSLRGACPRFAPPPVPVLLRYPCPFYHAVLPRFRSFAGGLPSPFLPGASNLESGDHVLECDGLGTELLRAG